MTADRAPLPMSTNEMSVMDSVSNIRMKQREQWGYEHDRHHEDWEWLGLIAKYAAAGRYDDAAALCIAAGTAQLGDPARLAQPSGGG